MNANAPTRTVTLDYAAASELAADADRSTLRLALDGSRGGVGVRGRVADAGLFRDCIATVATILGSDLRYRHRDRAAYLAFLAKKGKRASAAIWEAQKQFLDEELGTDKRPTSVLDPVLTVHPDEVSIEVFSRDESSYARLALDASLFDGRQAAHGTSCVDLTPKVAEAIDRLRTWLPVELEAGHRIATRDAGTPRTLDVPWAWLRGFLQVQSAATLPATACELAPIDLYNLLFALRVRRAKTSPRALRFELLPGEPPRLVLEPWELVLESHGARWNGTTPRVVRTFGRARLAALARLLPHVKRARVQLAGHGLPVFWVLEMGKATLSLALTGWSESGWSSAAQFDQLMPQAADDHMSEAITATLDAKGPLPFDEVVRLAEAPADAVRGWLQRECLKGRILYDLAKERYRPRRLLAEPIDPQAIRYGSPREARAHRLLGDGAPGTGEVELTKIHEIAGEGTEIHGQVTDREARRAFSPRFLLDLEGRVREASCGCPGFRRAGMREGPCEHMIAIRLAWARRRAEEEKLRGTPEGRRLIRAETRTFTRRGADGVATVYRVSLDEKLLVVRWGKAAEAPREQRLWFDSDADARDAYFARQERLAADGYVDADA